MRYMIVDGDDQAQFFDDYEEAVAAAGSVARMLHDEGYSHDSIGIFEVKQIATVEVEITQRVTRLEEGE